MPPKRFLLLFVLFAMHANAQIPVELSFGNRYGAGDVLWLRPFEEASPFLFFQRTRVSITYENSVSSSVLGVASYNLAFGGGIAVEGRVVNAEFAPGGGIQYYTAGSAASLFSLGTVGFGKTRKFNYFVLVRYAHPSLESSQLTGQVELSGTFLNSGHSQSSMRLRVGAALHGYQIGPLCDLSVRGSNRLLVTANVGVFVRKVF
jgi:hypothetical protein